MKFTVVTLRAAERDFQGILEYIAARSKTGATAWAKAFDKALAYLEESADSCPLAPENDHVDFESVRSCSRMFVGRGRTSSL